MNLYKIVLKESMVYEGLLRNTLFVVAENVDQAVSFIGGGKIDFEDTEGRIYTSIEILAKEDGLISPLIIGEESSPLNYHRDDEFMIVWESHAGDPVTEMLNTWGPGEYRFECEVECSRTFDGWAILVDPFEHIPPERKSDSIEYNPELHTFSIFNIVRILRVYRRCLQPPYSRVKTEYHEVDHDRPFSDFVREYPYEPPAKPSRRSFGRGKKWLL